MKIWSQTIIRRPNQNPSGTYKDRARNKTLQTLVDLDESDENESINE